jgi:hypothetical protein
VVSIFGAMFSARPFEVAKEMVRVTKPGGRIVMGNWIPGDPTLVAQILKISSSYTPPPPEGFVSPMTWGLEEQRDRALHRGRRSEEASRSPATATRSTSPMPRRRSSTVPKLYGPTMNAFEAAQKNGRADEAAQGAGRTFRRAQQKRES